MQHNQKGSTMLVTMVLMAIFGIMLAGFHMAVISITARIDDTYSEKQTYLYARSAVTAVTEDIMEKSAAYTTALEDYQAQVDASEEELELVAPEKDALLAAMDGLTLNGTPLQLTDITFPEELVDTYDLNMTIERVQAGETEAYKLSATATIEEISDTVSILLNMSGQEVILEQTITTTVPGTTTPPPTISNTVPEISGSMAGIYCDFGLQFTGNGDTFKEVKNDPQIVSGTDVIYDGEYKWDLDKSDITFMSHGDMTLDGSPEEKTIKHCNFYVDGDLSIKGKVKFEENCNIYVSGNVIVDSSDVTFDKVNIKCNGYQQNKTPSKSNTTIEAVREGEITTAELATEMAKIPPRHRPTWVDEADAGTRTDVYVVEAGETQKVTASKDYIWVKAGGTLIVDANNFQGEIYGDPPTTDQYNAIANGTNTINGLKSQLAVVQLNKQSFQGTITAPVIQVTTSNEFNYTYKQPSGKIPAVGEYDNFIDNSTSSGSTGTTNPNSGFSGIYTDTPIDFQWKEAFFPYITSGATIACNQDVEYNLHDNIQGGKEHPKIMNDGNMGLKFVDSVSISNVDFYIAGNLTLDCSSHSIVLNHCNFYVTGKMECIVNSGAGSVTLNQCNVQSNGWEITGHQQTEINNGSTIIKDATLTSSDLKIPERPEPSWVIAAQGPTENTYTYGDTPMVPGQVYRLDNTFGQYNGTPLTDAAFPATGTPVTVIVGSGTTVNVEAACGENVQFLVEPGGVMYIKNSGFHGVVYSAPVAGTPQDSVIIYELEQFGGTFIVPKLTIQNGNSCSYGGQAPVTGGGSTGDTTTTVTKTETVTYNLYEDYLYIRG